MRNAVLTGLEVLSRPGTSILDGRRVGLLANHASVDRHLAHAIELLAAKAGLVALYGPEHGLRGEAQDMEAAGSGQDSATGLPIHSLYGSDADSLAPSGDMLADIDVLVCDLQDVGSRYYTFAATLFHVMEEAATAGVAVVVADRPNPLGGDVVEGPGLQDGFQSFVGRLDVPVRHGLTMGEMAMLFMHRSDLDLDLKIIPMEGWQRSMSFQDTGLPWVAPSPNMPTLDTATLYPGGCLIEGTHLSEGRGTTRPFEYVGAPWLDPVRLSQEINELGHPGVVCRPHWFKPVAQKFAGTTCAGVQIHITEHAAVRSFALYVDLLAAARRQNPDSFSWRTEAYEFVTDRPAIDLLAGSSRLRQMVDAGGAAGDLAAEWAGVHDAFMEERQSVLLYSGGR